MGTKKTIKEVHVGRYSGSGLGCPRSQALHILGYEPVYGKKLKEKFGEGAEHDEVMKEEAEEEFDDFEAPTVSTIFKLTRGDTTAEMSLTPDGIRDEEIVEFKGLAASFSNSLKTEKDIMTHSALSKKYYRQVQAYAGAFKKPMIRFRIKNKKNLKVHDIIFKANPRIWAEIKNEIMNTQELLNQGKLPEKSCNSKEEKYCPYRVACKKRIAEEVEEIKAKPLSYNTKSELTRFIELYLGLKADIESLEADKEKLFQGIKKIMKSHGQREQELVPGTVKYGIRYKERKNAEDIEALVEAGEIRTEEAPEEYCAVYGKGDKDG